MKRFNPALLLALSACSSLGGRNASDWTPTVLARTDTPALPDYSFAGYRWGEATPPRPSATIVQASAYGVVANDGSDDTAGLRAAVAAASRVTGWAVVQLPAGEVELRNLLFLERSQSVFRGAGSGAGGTVLRMPHPMRDMDQPNVMTELNTYLRANDRRADNKEFFTPYSWTGGIIWTRVPEGTPAESNVSIAGDARGTRDSHQFTVSKLGSLRVGQTVRLGWFNRDGKNGPFLQHLYGKRNGLAGARLWENPEVPLITQEVMIDAISGTAITIHEPLLHDLRPEWSAVLAPEVRLEEVRLAEVGIEGLRIEFPNVPYVLHHLEPGYNAIYLTDVRNGWVRDVRLKKNADSGILSDRCSNLTLTGIQVHGRMGHYGVHLGDVERVLLSEFEISAWEHHPVSFNTGARQSVITNGRVISPQLDQHRGTNHTNLYDNLSIVEPGDTLRVFEHGGAGYWGPTHGVANTFWNVRLSIGRPSAFPSPAVLDGVNDSSVAFIVGFTANVPVRIDYAGAVIEGTNRPGLSIPSLYAYQLTRRLRREVR